jgi:hypothetical protein
MMIERRYKISDLSDAPEHVRSAVRSHPPDLMYRWKRAGYSVHINAYEVHTGNVVRSVSISVHIDDNLRSDVLDFLGGDLVVRRVPLHHLEPLIS